MANDMKDIEIGDEITAIHTWRGRFRLRVLDKWFDRIAQQIMTECCILEGNPARHDSESRRHEPGDIIVINPSHLRLSKLNDNSGRKYSRDDADFSDYL